MENHNNMSIEGMIKITISRLGSPNPYNNGQKDSVDQSIFGEKISSYVNKQDIL